MIACTKPRSDTPEPDFTALSLVMEEAILHARMLIRYQKGEAADRERQIHDVMDATENIVSYLLRHDDFWAFDGLDRRMTILWYLKNYDDKWSKTEHGTSLLKCYLRGRKIVQRDDDQ